jgi:hypothetical protein
MASAKSTPCLRRFAAVLPCSHSYCTQQTVPDIGSSDKGGVWRGLAPRRMKYGDCSALWRTLARHGR